MRSRGCAEICEAFELRAAKDIDLRQETYRRFFRLCPDAQGLMGHSDEPMRGRMLEQTYEHLKDAKLQGQDSYVRWEIRNHVSAYGVSVSMYGTFFRFWMQPSDKRWAGLGRCRWRKRGSTASKTCCTRLLTPKQLCAHFMAPPRRAY